MKRKESVLTSEVRTGFTGFTGFDVHSRVQDYACCASSYEGKNTLARFVVASLAAVFWAVTQRSTQKKRLLTSELHSFPCIGQS